jgi:monovalent cation/hydrogen antiporter
MAALEQAREALPGLAGEEVTGQLRAEYDRRLRVLRAGEPDGVRQWEEQDRALRLAALAHKHHTVVRLRDEGTIDDEVLRGIQTDLDPEEVQIHNRGFGGNPAESSAD